MVDIFAALTCTSYESLEAMYEDSEQREHSPEVDYGVWWRPRRRLDLTVWRGSWIEATGEFYIVDQRRPFTHSFDRDVPPAVLILGTVHGRDRVENLLDGWADRCGEVGSLEWLMGKFLG